MVLTMAMGSLQCIGTFGDWRCVYVGLFNLVMKNGETIGEEKGNQKRKRFARVAKEDKNEDKSTGHRG